MFGLFKVKQTLYKLPTLNIAPKQCRKSLVDNDNNDDIDTGNRKECCILCWRSAVVITLVLYYFIVLN